MIEFEESQVFGYKILAPVMIPGLVMERYYEKHGHCLACFSADEIEKYKNKYDAKQMQHCNIEHTLEILTGAVITKSFLINDDTKKDLLKEFLDLSNGTWMIEQTFTNVKDYYRIINSGCTGLSVQGKFPIIDAKGYMHLVYDKFERMSNLSDNISFSVFIYEGCTWGAGPNEHGEAHFTLKEKSTNKEIGKIYMPTKKIWQNSNFKEKINLLQVFEGEKINTKSRKKFVHWLDNNDNLICCHNQWNYANKDNNRVKLIF